MPKVQKKRHHARVCRSKQPAGSSSQKKPVRYVEEQKDVEYVCLNSIHTTDASKAYATFGVFGKSQNGASCSVISFKDYLELLEITEVRGLRKQTPFW